MILGDFHVILPRFQSTQQETIAWLTKAHEKSQSGLSKIVSRYVCKPDRVGHRYHSLEDFKHTDWKNMRIFKLQESTSGAGMHERMKFFSEVTNEIFVRFYAEEKSSPEEIIHVTCTGYVSPSAAQMLVSKKNWGSKTIVTHAYHMGCYAAIPAIKMAQAAKDRIDIVHTELCSLHFNPSIREPEQLVVQGLFADGFIRYSAFSEKEFLQRQIHGLELVAISEEIIPDTSDDMTWTIADDSLRMTLARDISSSIGKHLPTFLKRMCKGDDASMRKHAIFAIHPGGPKIIDDIYRILDLKKEQIRFSEKILFEHGNISSATIPHIWKEIVDDDAVPDGQKIISLAFGPGLTIAGAILVKRKAS